jgi:hypothetical protein
MGEWRYSSSILDLGSRWKSVFSFTLRLLYLRDKQYQYPQNERLAGQNSVFEKVHLAMLGIEPRPSSP